MKLSNETLTVLKNYASINSNMVFRGGNTIKTMAEAKNILATATVKEEFPDATFGIYDLNEFLNAIEMFDDPELVFADDMNSVTVKQDTRSIRYFFSDPQILTSPSKDIQMPTPEVKFELTADDLATIRRAASTLSVSDVVVSGSGNDQTFTAEVTDLADATSNSFSLDLAVIEAPDTEFKFVFNVANFKVLPTDYQVSVSSKLISHLEGKTANYWIALEKTSTYGN
jgi:hypothetical protein